jgi:hypothetical protein
MTAFTKFIEPAVVEIVMDSPVDAAAVVETTVDIAVVAASEATTVVIGAADAVVLVVADLLVPVDRTKRKLQQSGQNGGFHYYEIFILQSYLVALTLDHSFRASLVRLLQVSCNLVYVTLAGLSAFHPKLHDT